jgi:hypothetical protein
MLPSSRATDEGMKAKSAGSSIRIKLKGEPEAHSAAMTRPNDLFPASSGEYSMTN